MADPYDVIVIGAGPGGYVAAIRAAQLGMRVACVEKRSTLGGTCLNVGCIPSKALLDSSELFVQARTHFSHHGIKIGDIGLDLATLLARKDRVVKGLTEGVAYLFKKHKIDSFVGTARLLGHGTVALRATNPNPAEGRSVPEEQVLEAKAILIATGSEPKAVPTLPFDGSHIVSSTEALAFERVPQHLVVVGAGYIGLELGSVWSRLGAKVTVVEFLPRILSFHLETRVTTASIQGGQVMVNANSKGKDVLLQADKVLVAVGRRPFTRGLGLEEAGVVVDETTGAIPVDENFQTNVPGIYAIGDVIPGPMLAHKAEDDGIAFAERLAGKKTHVDYNTVPSVIYTWPEVASVGPTEEQIKASGRAYRVGKFPFSANGRARCMDETEGVVKVIADASTDRLLAVHIFGPRASDLIAECVSVMEFGGSAEDIARTCHAHPTLSEAVREAAFAVDGRAIHM
jgi:dihydrolipoamide dehydrogenase